MEPRYAPAVTHATSFAPLVRQLASLGALDQDGDAVAALLQAVRVPPPVLLRQLPFRRDGYTRTLVHREQAFEVLLLAWTAGSAAPPHDHDGQSCWLVPLVGRFDAEDYDVQHDGSFAARLTRLGSRRLDVGCCDRRDADHAVHSVRVATTIGVSLHVYARPIERCRVFDPAHDRWRWRRLRYDARSPGACSDLIVAREHARLP